jgi:hypothetical protein
MHNPNRYSKKKCVKKKKARRNAKIRESRAKVVDEHTKEVSKERQRLRDIKVGESTLMTWMKQGAAPLH